MSTLSSDRSVFLEATILMFALPRISCSRRTVSRSPEPWESSSSSSSEAQSALGSRGPSASPKALGSVVLTLVAMDRRSRVYLERRCSRCGECSKVACPPDTERTMRQIKSDSPYFVTVSLESLMENQSARISLALHEARQGGVDD
jgi:hypothetical protein